ncbi:hypothetical protein JKP88DRAFT_273760 [Tribonema minus]|uniref:Uncharacterized protein n=1 Tax=Tribonema minus TaxID=303371 RepID=A0A835YPZ3_9STRA|nr:hypothetical protein JKP88DRAFT_273760 [Tribonema minus]
MDDGAQVHAALTFEAQVSRMMRSFPDDASIQVWGTHAIRAQIWDDVNNIEFKDRLGQAGACAALDLQAAAASAIESMAERNNGAGAAAIAQQFLDAGAGEALKEALAASTIGGATSDTLKALTALAHYGAGAAQLLAAGVAEAIVAAAPAKQ